MRIKKIISKNYFLNSPSLYPIYYHLRDFYRTAKNEENRERFKINFLFWSVLAICNLLDILFSYHVFEKGAIEANPVMGFFFTKFGSISIAFIKGALLGILLVLLPFIKNGLQKLLIIVCIVYLFLVLSHFIRFF